MCFFISSLPFGPYKNILHVHLDVYNYITKTTKDQYFFKLWIELIYCRDLKIR